jgi:hypothetical protein
MWEELKKHPWWTTPIILNPDDQKANTEIAK